MADLRDADSHFAFGENPRALRPSSSGLVFVALIVAALVALVIAERFLHVAAVSYDSYQYISISDSVSHGAGIKTSIVHFDVERRHGVVPAPETTFPFGYPLLISIARPAFGNTAAAAVAVSALGFFVTALVSSLTAWLKGLRLWPLVGLLIICNAAMLAKSITVLSESIFTAFVVTAIFFVELGRREKGSRRYILLLVLGYGTAALSYYVRNAGLFIVIGLLVEAGVRVALERTRRATLGAVVASVTSLLIIPGFVRNIIVTGTWRGGNDVPVHRTMLNIAYQFFEAQVHSLVGVHRWHLHGFEMLLVGGVAASAALLAMRAAKHGLADRRTLSSIAASAALLATRAAKHGLAGRRTLSSIETMLVVVGVYDALMCYAGMNTMISFGPRMFLPMVPLVITVCVAALDPLIIRDSAARASVAAVSLAAIAVGYIGVNAEDLHLQETPPATVVAGVLQEPVNGQNATIAAWLAKRISARNPLFSTYGQETGYALGLPTVSLPGRAFTTADWNCTALRHEMSRFRARYLLIYRHALSGIEDDPVYAESPTIAALRRGYLECGFRMAAESHSARVLSAD